MNNMDALMDDPSCQLKNGDELKKSPEKPVRSSVIRTEEFPPRTSASIPSSSSDFSKAADVKPLNDIVVNNGKGFTFPFASAPSISQPPSTPTIATPLAEKTVAQKGESVFPLFSFGSEDSNRLEFSSATTMGSSNATSGLKHSTRLGLEYIYCLSFFIIAVIISIQSLTLFSISRKIIFLFNYIHTIWRIVYNYFRNLLLA